MRIIKIIITLTSIFTFATFSIPALAYNSDWDDQYGYIEGHPCSACACTDPGYHWNTCINKTTYCEAFGNMGKNSIELEFDSQARGCCS